MVYQEELNANKAAIAAISLRLEQRMEWAQISKVERLERALVAARGMLRWNNSGTTAKAH